MMKLVPYWRSAWRLMSVWIGATATFVTVTLAGFPAAALQAWAWLPQEIKAYIPPERMPLIGAVLMGLAVLSRLVHQPKAQAVIAEKLAERPPPTGGVPWRVPDRGEDPPPTDSRGP